MHKIKKYEYEHKDWAIKRVRVPRRSFPDLWKSRSEDWTYAITPPNWTMQQAFTGDDTDAPYAYRATLEGAKAMIDWEEYWPRERTGWPCEGYGAPYQWGKDADGSGDWWTVETPFLFNIKKAGKGCYRLIYLNDDNKELGVFPTVKQAKAAAEEFVPEVV